MSRAALGLAAALLLGACGAGSDPPSGYPTARVTIGDDRIEAEVADTRERQARGLSGRRSLGRDRGMLFPYARAGRYGFWMPDMHFDIDIVWIRGDRIVDISHRVSHIPVGPPPTIRPREPADLVLEVEAGSAVRRGWRIGDAVAVEPEVRPGDA